MKSCKQVSLLEFKWPHLCSGSGGLTPYVIDASFEDEDAEEDEEDETPPSAVHFSSIWEASLNPGHNVQPPLLRGGNSCHDTTNNFCRVDFS